ncbi:MAG: hypothetical protein KDE45_18175, partial [Caldilineaceae bacterium]|nr:hypothetical protein [Caldilineaceae bacterium]
MQMRQLRHQCQSQPRAALFAVDLVVQLREGLEQTPKFSRWDADARIPHRQPHLALHVVAGQFQPDDA